MDRIMTWGTKKGQPSRPLTYEIPITSRRSACLELVSIFGILTPRHVLVYNSSNNSNLEMVLLVHLSRDFLLNISIHLFIKMICKKFMDHSMKPKLHNCKCRNLRSREITHMKSIMLLESMHCGKLLCYSWRWKKPVSSRSRNFRSGTSGRHIPYATVAFFCIIYVCQCVCERERAITSLIFSGELWKVLYYYCDFTCLADGSFMKPV